LVLYLNNLPKVERAEGMGMCIQLMATNLMSSSESCFTSLPGQDPLLPELEVCWLGGEGITKLTGVQHLGW
jgi:hypothetical protein